MYDRKGNVTTRVIKWTHFENRGYCAFASLKRVVCIGVLSAATLSIAARAEVG